MDTEERNRIMKAFYDPELSDVARLAKGIVGVAILGLIGAIAGTSSEDINDAGAPMRTVRAATAKAADRPVARQLLRQAQGRAVEDPARLRDSSMQQRPYRIQ